MTYQSVDLVVPLTDGCYVLVGEDYDFDGLPAMDPRSSSPPPLSIATTFNVGIVLANDQDEELELLARYFEERPPVRYEVPDWDEITDATLTSDSALWVRTLEQEPLARLTDSGGSFNLRLHARRDDARHLERGEKSVKHYLQVWPA